MKPSQVIPEKCRGFEAPDQQITYDTDLAITYALGIGFSRDPLNLQQLNFTYELAQNFQIFPTFGVIAMRLQSMFDALSTCEGIPQFNPMMGLHGEHKIQIFHPYESSQKLKLKNKLIDVADKTKGALFTFQIDAFNQQNQLVFRNILKSFIRGIGGFGDKGQLQSTLPTVPDRAPDFQVQEKTDPNQAIIYRLASDHNPLHISPDMAALGGFERPILHGLCFFGIAAKHVMMAVCNLDCKQMKSIEARFTSHVFPGDTLVTQMWKNGNRVVFAQKTLERGKVCCQGAVELNAPVTPSLQLMDE